MASVMREWNERLCLNSCTTLSEHNMNRRRTPPVQKFACGVGHVMNDLYRGMASYILIFMVKVAGLTGKQAGYILLVCQVTDSFLGPLIGYCSDNLSLPLIARCVGRRKAWHLAGTVLMAILFSLMFTRCLFCQGSSNEAKFAYYGVVFFLINIAFPAIDIGHLSVISVVAKNQDECITLNAIRTLFSCLSGLCAYVVAGIILGAKGEAGLSESSWKEFTMINIILAGIGLLFSGGIFHLGTREPKETESKKKIRDLVTKTGLNSVALMFTLGTNVEEEEGTDRKTSEVRRMSDSSRKTSVLRKISSFLVPFETGTEYLEEHRNKDSQDTNEEIERKRSEPNRRKSWVFIGLGAGMVTSFVDDGYLQRKKLSLEQRKSSSNSIGLESARTTSLSKEPEASYGNKGFQADVLDNENDKEVAESERVHDSVHHGVDSTPSASAVVNMGSRKKKSSFPVKIADACHIDERQCNRIPKSRKEWLKDPKLYAACLIYTFTRLLQSYGYMAFYLTDYLKLPTASIAYFPLILLVSALVGTAFAKLLTGRLGNKWTYCLAAAILIGAAVGFYFLKPNTNKTLAYVLTVLMGIGMSSTFVVGLAFLTDLIGDNKETSGFVFSIASFVAKISSGAYFIGVQNFYPTNGDVGPFARYVFSFSMGILAFLGFVTVVLSQTSKLPERNRPHRSSGGRRQAVQQLPSAVRGKLSLAESEKETTWDTRL